MIEKLVLEKFGKKYLTYLENKHKGGLTNEKGNIFENFYATYKIVDLLVNMNEIEIQRISISSQEKMFVDDLIIENSQNKLNCYYQLKNTDNISWGNGFKSIEDDFFTQILLCSNLGIECLCNLVVSNKELQEKLQSHISDRIRHKSNVEFFAHHSTLTNTIKNNSSFEKTLQLLCPVNDLDKIETLAAVILGEWVACGKQRITIFDIYQKIKDITFIKPLFEKFELDGDVKIILDSIVNFKYNIDSGFLIWSYGDGIEEGILQNSCASGAFKKFQLLIKEYKPSSFESLENFLV